ncbi:hypothetical protein PhCBS80983_g01422 [Powellomyces hirtus]|uniref:FAM192A/Fyv6 N-terminal domain-containing protein n=1 Tax=Powellomyces hirtus TaxID=109895 RepID=A0A507EA67_9FUNG|nr:hypothetical protein PhCBS80983_g01422 [Powellomyces hirtus]
MSFSSSLPATTNPSAAIMASKFVTQTEAESTRAVRQAEAAAEGREYVEKEEVFDPRPLYEKLADKKRIEEEEFAEKMKFGNLVHRLDEEEYEFLSNYDNENTKKSKEIALETRQQLDLFRKAVSEAATPIDVSKVPLPLAPPPPTQHKNAKDFQRAALKGVVVRKRKPDAVVVNGEMGMKKMKVQEIATEAVKKLKVEEEATEALSKTDAGKTTSTAARQPTQDKKPLNPLGMIAAYSDDSADDSD